MNNSESRMKDIDAELQRELAENRKTYEELRQPDTLRCAAMAQGLTEDRLRRKLEQEEEETEQELRKEFRVKADAELARMLQAVDEPSEDERDIYPPAMFNPPAYNTPTYHPPSYNPLAYNPPLGAQQIFASRLGSHSLSTLNPSPATPSQSTISLPDRTHSKLPPLREPPFMSGMYSPGSNPPYVDPFAVIKRERETPKEINIKPYLEQPVRPHFTACDDDLQEISPAYFNSRFGGPPRFGPPPLPSRSLPWIHDPWGGDTDAAAKAMELVREQVEQDMDDDDFVYVSIACRQILY